MKKVIIIAVLILLTGITFGQVLQKGTVIGIYGLTIELKPGVTMEQFIQFYSNKYMPEWNKLTGSEYQRYLVKGTRGNIFANSYGMMSVIKSEQVWAKYFNPDGSQTEVLRSLIEKNKPLQDELNKLGTYVYAYTLWVVQ
jgi:hypothetical protein